MTRIAIDPTDLRRGATRIRDASSELSLEARSLGSVAMPEMPPGVAAEVEAGVSAVSSQLQGLVPILTEDVVELERRALWTEIADRMAAGYTLEGSQLREFVAWMKDGSLMRYATEEQAELAGAYVGAMYRDRFKDPEKLIELAQILDAAQQNTYGDVQDAFSAGFVERFGAENLVEVPRVIQAMEWARAFTFQTQTDPHVLEEVSREWGENELEQDPVNDLLAPFSLALANATYSGRLAQTVEEEIAHDDDTWATAQLLHTGVFGTRFLLECFRTGVVDRIVEESSDLLAGHDVPRRADYPLGAGWPGGDGEGLPRDTKQLVLDALARNPDAAREAFTTPLEGVELSNYFGEWQEVTNPVRLLYDYGAFDDDGDSFGHAYLAAANDLQSDPRDTASVDTGNLLTLDVLDRVLHGDRVALDGVGGLTDALARDLAEHHLEGLHYSAAAGDEGDADSGRAGWTDPSFDHRIHLSEEELVDVLAAVTDREDAGQSFLDAAARYQAETILAGTESSPTFHSEFSWAHRSGSFTQLLLEAGDLNRTEDFQEADARKKMIVGFVNDVVGLAKVPPLVDIAIDRGIDTISSNLGPSADELVQDNNRAHAVLENGVTAAIVQGYADNGHIDLSGAEERELVEDGRLIRYNELDGVERARFHDWMNNDPEVSRVIREAVQEANR
jgi:hypothetical protein